MNEWTSWKWNITLFDKVSLCWFSWSHDSNFNSDLIFSYPGLLYKVLITTIWSDIYWKKSTHVCSMNLMYESTWAIFYCTEDRFPKGQIASPFVIHEWESKLSKHGLTAMKIHGREKWWHILCWAPVIYWAILVSSICWLAVVGFGAGDLAVNPMLPERLETSSPYPIHFRYWPQTTAFLCDCFQILTLRRRQIWEQSVCGFWQRKTYEGG